MNHRFVASYGYCGHNPPYMKGLNSSNAVDAILEAFDELEHTINNNVNQLARVKYLLSINGEEGLYIMIWDNEKDMEITENWENYLIKG